MRTTNALRIPGSPVLVGKTWRLVSDGAVRSVPVIAGAAEGDDVVQVPEDLTAITDDELETLEGALVAEFDKLADAKSTDLAAMTAISEAIKRVRGESTAREEADAAAAEEVARMRAEVHPDGDGEGENAEGGDSGEGEGGDEGGDDPGDGAPAGDGGGAGQAREPITAAARAAQRRTSASGVAANSRRPAAPDTTQRVTIVAAGGVPGLDNGQLVNLEQVAIAMHNIARTLPEQSKRTPVASFNLVAAGTPLITPKMSAETVQALIAGLSDPIARGFTDANALVAAGGWCTPSQNMYDLLALDAATGLLDLPTVAIERGGLNVPSYIGIDSADAALWHWTEGKDQNIAITITDLDTVGGVGSATNSGNNRLEVGDYVNLHMSAPAMDGPWRVATVADATHFTLTMTGVADLSNATGTGRIQKGRMRITCPTWTDYRLEAYGWAVDHGNLTHESFPELDARWLQLVMNAHLHRMSSVNIAKITAASNSDAVTVTAVGTDSYGELMSALELSVVDYRSQHKISDRVIIEVLLPNWTQEMLRSNLAMRAGVDLLAVSDATLAAHLAIRNVRAQFLEDYQPMWNGAARQVWPTTLQFTIYPAGGFIEGTGPKIDLSVMRDRAQIDENDYTAGWTEQFDLIARRGPKARKVTATITTDGITACCP